MKNTILTLIVAFFSTQAYAKDACFREILQLVKSTPYAFSIPGEIKTTADEMIRRNGKNIEILNEKGMVSIRSGTASCLTHPANYDVLLNSVRKNYVKLIEGEIIDPEDKAAMASRERSGYDPRITKVQIRWGLINSIASCRTSQNPKFRAFFQEISGDKKVQKTDSSGSR